METPTTKLMLAAVAAISIGAMADNTVKVTKFHQSYPYSGKATVEYTVGGTLPANAIAEFKIDADDASATFVQSNIVAGANSYVIDFASSFGGALLLTNASFVVSIMEASGGSNEELGGVQLWENGPYWAECNVGATKPEEYGYYFWWGDTVGYKFVNGTWVATDGSTSNFSFSSGNAPTCGKDNATLQSAGYIDATGNLVAAHDAATAHLGSPWRMPTDAEFDALFKNCTTEWTLRNGVYGRLVKGKPGAYAAKSIFLPAAGYGSGSDHLYDPGSYGHYWSSTPNSDDSEISGELVFDWLFATQNNGGRHNGQSVRPVRGFAQ